MNTIFNNYCCKDVQNIIEDYKEQLENKEKFDKVINQMNNKDYFKLKVNSQHRWRGLKYIIKEGNYDITSHIKVDEDMDVYDVDEYIFKNQKNIVDDIFKDDYEIEIIEMNYYVCIKEEENYWFIDTDNYKSDDEY